MKADHLVKIFDESIAAYHILDNVDQQMPNPFPTESVEFLMFKKNWIDTVQWHLEDIIRDIHIKAEKALEIKRRIDASNQDRTDLVEAVDDYFFDTYKNVSLSADARLNTETPGWAIDRLSILRLKVYHMNVEVNRSDATVEHINKCSLKLSVLNEQSKDLLKAIDELFEDLQSGKRIAKTYKQMKMYNDPELNPVLRKVK